ncbi:co-chaperone GroES [bacterium]
MKLVPLGDRVVLQRLETADDKTAGGILLPDNAREKPQEAKVVAVGPGKKDDDGKLIDMEVKVGDVVLTAKWGGTEFKIEGEDYVIVSEDEILAKIAKK